MGLCVFCLFVRGFINGVSVFWFDYALEKTDIFQGNSSAVTHIMLQYFCSKSACYGYGLVIFIRLLCWLYDLQCWQKVAKLIKLENANRFLFFKGIVVAKMCFSVMICFFQHANSLLDKLGWWHQADGLVRGSSQSVKWTYEPLVESRSCPHNQTCSSRTEKAFLFYYLFQDRLDCLGNTEFWMQATQIAITEIAKQRCVSRSAI